MMKKNQVFKNKNSIKAWVSMSFKFGVCNLSCEYCYIGHHNNKLNDIHYSLEEIRLAFSYKRLGGTCLINICSDGETLIHPLMPSIIKVLLEEGHYVMVVTNGTLKKRIEECLLIENRLLKRLFFKISFQYAELKKKDLIALELENINLIKKSPCSFSLEYIFDSNKIGEVEELKKICSETLGALPQVAIPRDDRKYCRGIMSKYSWDNYQKIWDKIGYKSNFFDFKRQIFGKKYKEYCYAGERALWINMETGYSYQCYNTPPLQKFMEYKKPVIWLAIGNNCPESYCYNCHALMAIGVAPFSGTVKYKATYEEIRNRLSIDGEEWLKPIYKDVFKRGVYQKEHNKIRKKITNYCNIFLKWNQREKYFK